MGKEGPREGPGGVWAKEAHLRRGGRRERAKRLWRSLAEKNERAEASRNRGEARQERGQWDGGAFLGIVRDCDPMRTDGR